MAIEVVLPRLNSYLKLKVKSKKEMAGNGCFINSGT